MCCVCCVCVHFTQRMNGFWFFPCLPVFLHWIAQSVTFHVSTDVAGFNPSAICYFLSFCFFHCFFFFYLYPFIWFINKLLEFHFFLFNRFLTITFWKVLFWGYIFLILLTQVNIIIFIYNIRNIKPQGILGTTCTFMECLCG